MPPAETDSPMELRKYGFHGLSYASIVDTLSEHLKKPKNKINIVVAHLGSGASSCCILNGQSIDTSMGLTPLEGLIGGTRAGTIDPTTIFHALTDPGADAGIQGMKVTKAEYVLNKKCGLVALAGTTNFGAILSSVADKSAEDHERASKAYLVYKDRLMNYLAQYICKLLAKVPIEEIDGLVFSGGIGEKGAQLRADVLDWFKWMGAEVDKEKNENSKGTVREITTAGSKLKGWVVETDEEGQTVALAREQLDF